MKVRDIDPQKTRVVNVRDFPPGSESAYIYVGRGMPGRFAGHELGNPFKIERKAGYEQRWECLDKYMQWLDQHPDRDAMLDRLAAQVRATGLPLGCWCHPLPCHAHLLAVLVDTILTR